MEDSKKPEVATELLPHLRIYKDGTIERLTETSFTPAGLDPETGVLSKDIIIIPETGVSARFYRPKIINPHHKLPLIVYYHGGAFYISSNADPAYHGCLNSLVAEANIIVLSVNYRLAPEHPLPTAYEDSWSALEWISNQTQFSSSQEPWLKDFVDFQNVFLVGDSAGANISHHLALRFKDSDLSRNIKIVGIGLIHPYFWGKEPIGMEIIDHDRRVMVDGWWKFVCPSDRGSDDLHINPFAEGAPGIEGLGCEKVLVFVAEKDIFKERGKLYHEKLVKSEWKGQVEMLETEGEDHVFHIFNPTCEKAKSLIRRLASFINQK